MAVLMAFLAIIFLSLVGMMIFSIGAIVFIFSLRKYLRKINSPDAVNFDMFRIPANGTNPAVAAWKYLYSNKDSSNPRIARLKENSRKCVKLYFYALGLLFFAWLAMFLTAG